MLDSRANGGSAISADLLDLVKRCRDGDPEAWRALAPYFQAIGRRALRSFRFTSSDEDDVLADTLAALYRGGLTQFRGETVPQLLAFLKAIVRNRALDVLKGNRKWLPSQHLPGIPTGENVEEGVADEQCVEFLRQEIARLKPEDRELYLMKARGMKEREIAEQTGRPPGTVSSQIARLLQRLRSALRERGCL